MKARPDRNRRWQCSQHALQLQRVFRVWLVAILLAGLGIAGIWSRAVVADPTTATEVPQIQQVFLPLEELEKWPLGDRQPMLLRDFQKLRSQAIPDTDVQPSHVAVSHAVYTATLEGAKLHSGTLSLVIERTGSESQLLSLGPVNLAMTGLHWLEGDAIWGRSPAGQTELLVDRSHGVVEGRWLLGGKPLARGHEFRFQGIPATVGRLKLRFPTDKEVTVTGAEVISTRPSAVGNWQDCEIALSPQGNCQIFVRPAPAATMSQPLTFVRQEFAYAARQEGVRLQADFNIEVFRAPAQHVEFAIDPEIQVYSVIYGGELPLTWRETETGGNRRLSVELPDPILGQSRQIRLRGIIPIRIDQNWKMPRLRMVDAVLSSGQISLTVQAPLELKSLDTGGMRQTGVEGSAIENETLTFRQFQGDGSLSVQFGQPSLKVAARAFMDVETQKDGWTAKARLGWTSRAGSVFTLRCLIPEGWEVTDVKQDAATASGDLNWSIVPRGDGAWLLELRFLESLTPERKKQVDVLARRPAVPPDQTSPVPAFTPLDVDDLEMYVAITAENTVRPVLELGTTFEPIKFEDLVPNSPAAEFWNEHLARRTSTPLLLKLSDLVPDGGFSLQSLQTPVDVDVRVRATLARDRLSEEVEVHVTPQHGRADRVLIHLSETGSPMSWRFAKPSQLTLDATKLPVVRHAAWDLPPTGELWEIRLPLPPSDPFVLIGERSRGLPPEGRIGLAFVPQANTFQGTLAVTAEDLLDVQWQPRELERIETELPPTEENREDRSSIQWQYDSAQASLRFRLPDDPSSPRPFVIRRLDLKTQFSLSRASFDRCTADFHLDGSPKDLEFSWTLPHDCEFLQAFVDGVLVHVDQDNGTFHISPLDFQARHISIQYRQPAAVTFGPQRRGISVPQVDDPVLEFAWHLQLPPGTILGEMPSGMQMRGPIVPISWKQRFLGPLGQPEKSTTNVRPDSQSGETPAEDAWLTLETDEREEGLGWTNRVAFSPVVPTRLRVEIWDARQAMLLQWCGLFGAICLGIVFRMIRLRGRGAIGVIALVTAMFAAASLPEVSAGIAGSCLLGTILAMFVPRKIATRPFVASTPPPDVPVGSTLSFHGQVVILLLCWGSFTQTFAQEPAGSGSPTRGPATAPDAAASQVNQVLIPVDATGQPLGDDPLVYVSPVLKEKLLSLQKKPPVPSTYLLSHADYEGSVDDRDSLVILAKYRVHVLEPQHPVTVRIPLRDASLGGDDACLLDGHPQPLTNSGIPGEFLLTIPASHPEKQVEQEVLEIEGSVDEARDGPVTAPVVHEIRLRLHPRTIISETGVRAQFGVAPLPSATLQLTFAQPVQKLTLADLTGEVTLTPDGLRGEAHLGMLGEIQLNWTRQASAPAPLAAVEARALALISVHPSELLFQYRIRCHVTDGQVDFLSWLLPDAAAIRSVSAPDLLYHTLQPAENGEVLLLMDFARAQKDDFEISLQFSLPNRGGPRTIELQPVRLAGADGMRTNIQLLTHRWGIQTPTEFQVDPPMTISESYASYSEEMFLEDWGMEVTPLTLVFNVQGPGILKLPIKPLLPTLVVRSNSVGRIGTRGLQWHMTASVEVRTAAAFQHRLQVDPRLRILSITVQEDAANRLMRWTRLGDQVIVFLNGRSTGTQTLTLNGIMPLQVPQQFQLPDIQFVNATTADARLLLYQDSELAVELINAETLERLEPTAEQRADGGRGLLVGRYRVTSEKLNIGVRLARNTPQLEYDSATLLRARDARWRMTTTLVFRVKQGHGSHFLLRIPPELSQFEIEAADTRQLQERARDGSLRVLLLPNQPVRDQFVVQVSGGVSIAPDAVWTPPEITPLNAQSAEHFLVVSPADALNVAQADRSGLEPAPLSAGLRRSMQVNEMTDGDFISYRGIMRPWGLTLHRAQPESLGAVVLLADSRVWLRHDGRVSGRSTFFVTPSELDEINLEFPPSTRVRSVLMDGRFINARQKSHETGQQLSVTLNSPQQGHLLSVFWEDEKSHNWRMLGKLTASLPQLKQLPIERALLTVVPPAGILIRGSEVLPTIPRNDLLLERLEALVKLTRIQIDAGQTEQDGARPAQLEELYRELTQTKLTRGQRARFEEIEIALRKIQGATSPDGSVATSTTSDRVNEFFGISDAVYFQPAETVSSLEIWYASRPVLSLSTAILMALAVFVIGLKLVGWNISATFQKYPSIVWTLLGLLWWFCLTPFWLAFLLWGLGIYNLIPRRVSVPPDEASGDFILV